jgi:hypothetical protein
MIGTQFQIGAVWRPKRGRAAALAPVIVTQAFSRDRKVTVGSDRNARRCGSGVTVAQAELRRNFVYVGQLTSWPQTVTLGEAIDSVMRAQRFELEGRRAA